MAPDTTENGLQCSSNPHLHARCKLCGEELEVSGLRHSINQADETSDSAATEKATDGSIEALNQPWAQNASDDSDGIPKHTVEDALQVDKLIDPEEKGQPSTHDTELEADATVLPAHQNHVQGNKAFAAGVPPHLDTDPKLALLSQNEKRNLRFSLATDINASMSTKEHLHKESTSSGENPEFTDYRTSAPVVKELYLSNGRWSEYANADIEAKELQRLSEKHDIVHRQIMREDVNKSGQLWETNSVTIRGGLKQTLQTRVFKDHPDVGGLNSGELWLSQPFIPVVHRWKMLEDLSNESPSPFGIETLMGILSPCVESKLSLVNSIRSSNFCSWDDLNLIFRPGEIVLSQRYGVQAAFKVRHVRLIDLGSYEPPYYHLILHYIDWNGQNCGYAHQFEKIVRFSEPRNISSLNVVPLDLLDKRSQVDIRAKLQSRGKRFEQLRGYHFKTSNGRRVVFERNPATGDFEPIDKHVNGRVIVDACAFYQCQDLAVPSLSRASGLSQSSSKTDTGKSDSIDNSETSDDSDSSSEAESLSVSGTVRSSNASVSPPTFATSMKPKKAVDINTFQREEDLTLMSDEDCLISNPFVKGMDIKSKEWSEFLVDELEEIQWIDEMFEKLVLPPTHKKVALASVRHRTSSLDMDFVPGKGRGLVMLMFGPPGVGKTLTAEAVAEKSRVPLYSLSAGELGTNSSLLEKALTNALNCCTLWHAVLLLDEADIFLATRTVDNLERNELVSIFLRLVEHYQGVLFLTTNRMEVIDPAFQSRVDFILPYAGLTPEAREEVWRNLVTRAGTERVDLTDEDIKSLAKLNLNGREIKNLLKSAMLLDDKVSAEELHGLALMRVEAQKLLGIE